MQVDAWLWSGTTGIWTRLLICGPGVFLSRMPGMRYSFSTFSAQQRPLGRAGIHAYALASLLACGAVWLASRRRHADSAKATCVGGPQNGKTTTMAGTGLYLLVGTA